MKNLLLLSFFGFLLSACSIGDLDIYMTERYPTMTDEEYFDTHRLPPVTFMITTYNKSSDATTVFLIDDQSEIRTGRIEGDHVARLFRTRKDFLENIKDKTTGTDNFVDIKSLVQNFRSLNSVDSVRPLETDNWTQRDIVASGFFYLLPVNSVNDCGPVSTNPGSQDYRTITIDQKADQSKIFSNKSTTQIMEWLLEHQKLSRG